MVFKRTYFKHGDWNAICDVCGDRHKASELKKRWDGLMVCSKDWEMRHPQEQIRHVPKDPRPLPWTRPRPTDVFLVFCSLEGQNAIGGVGTAGCAISGSSNGVLETTVTYPSTFNLSTL